MPEASLVDPSPGIMAGFPESQKFTHPGTYPAGGAPAQNLLFVVGFN